MVKSVYLFGYKGLPILLKKLSNIKSIHENYQVLDDLIDPYVSELLTDRIKNRQKILELCHLGKFLIFFDGKYQINEVTERPDFIITDGIKLIGLEHQIIVEFDAKAREGFFQNIFDQAEEKLKTDSDLPNFLANCYVMPYANFKINQKEELIETVRKVVKEYILNDNLIENPIIERISKMPHSQKSVNVNLGAWWTKDITKKLVEEAIKNKQEKLLNYQQEGIDEQWLLIVIGNTGDSSYDMDKNLKADLNTDFSKVFILEDFRNNLYQLK